MQSTIELTRPVTATGSPEAHKARLVTKAAAIAAERLAAAERGTAEHLVSVFYEHVPPSDVAACNPRDLAGAALSLWHFAARRRPGQAKVRVFNPEAAADGWFSPHTIVEIANDDMPFLVDSVTAALNTADRVVRLVIHPLPRVSRDLAGKLVALAANGDAGQAESWMHLEITREQDPAQLARLAQELAGVLVDVRAAVADWAAMRRTLRALLDELAAPPVPPAEAAEVREFLRWLDDDNFTFLGYREYDFAGEAEPPRPALGILRDPDYPIFGGLRDLSSLPADVQAFVRRRGLLVVTKANRRSTVHRRAHMDAIGLRRFGDAGNVVGIRLFLGLFTAAAYSRDPRAIPLLRQKVRHVVERAGMSPTSHDGKTLLHILDTLPRDELFQGEADELFATATGVLNLQERQRIALFVRRDPLERFVSCLVYAPRERYDSELRRRFAAILERAFGGSLSAFYTHLDESVLARIQFIIRTTRGAVPVIDAAAVERELAEAGRTWSDRFAEAAEAAFGADMAQARLRRLVPLPVAYQARNDVAQAVADLPRIDAVLAGSPLEVSLHATTDGARQGLRLYRAKEPVVLSDVLPLLENLNLRVVAEEPFRIDCIDGNAVWIHEFELADPAIADRDMATAVARFEEALGAIWAEREENDGFNRLVLAAGLTIRQVGVLRLYGKLMRQAGSPYSQAYMEDSLHNHPEIGRRLVRLFEIRFDPEFAGDRSMAAITALQAVDHALDAVASLDEDRMLRSFLLLILKTVRTNYYQRLPSGGAKPYLAIKLASSTIELLPRPRPLFEIYICNPRVEAVHMRAGKVARGGIRWSDRKEDFRTEILGLMKAQTVKNTVIVPVGAKGGFVVKRPPQAGERLVEEAVECYRLFMRGLLDLTDNIVADGPSGHRVVPPPLVVRYDDDDPYLVVAADKGTAAFSDYANAIAEEYRFWLGDAFASGGSTGYDHKVLGITARGAWELVKRHFRELGRNPETDAVSVVGVGDMSGDVFGNGMLLSRHLRLVGAFDHRHIFVDPEPDAETGFSERERLFRLPRSSWADYNRALISPGGGVFERSLKSVPISAEMKRRLDIDGDRLTPAELVRKLLAAAVDLLWFGGIGTFVKAPDESHAEVGDRTNDAVRIDGDQLRARVVGEGANLAVTERGRVAYALAGGRIDTDAIDNSAGVDTSDHEVNIKILVDRAVAAGALPVDERAPLLRGMASDVAHLVLRDNYLQGAALSLAEVEGTGGLERQVRLMLDLEHRGLLDRALEFLPDDKALAARGLQRRGLVRPELAVLLAYSKMALDAEILASDLPDDPELGGLLVDYFPPALRDRLGNQIGIHRLRREIIATIVTNDLVNRAGMTFTGDMQARTGRAAAQIARAYLIVRNAYDLDRRWGEIEALDDRVSAELQIDMLRDIGEVVTHAAGWLLRANRVDIAAETARLRPAVAALADIAAGLLPSAERALYDERVARFSGAGVPTPLARRLGLTIFLTTAIEIGDLALHTLQPIERVAGAFYGVGARFALDDLRAAARRLPAGSGWQKAAAVTLIDDFYGLQADLARRVLESAEGAADPLAAWSDNHAEAVAGAETVTAELRAQPPELAMLVVASRRLRQAAG